MSATDNTPARARRAPATERARGPRGRSRGLRRRRGIAIEALLMFPVLVTLCFVSFWTWDLFDARLGAMQDVREPVFTAALHGCGAGGSTSYGPFTPPTFPGSSETSFPFDPIDGADFGAVKKDVPNAPGGAVLERAFRSKAGRVVRAVIANGLVDGALRGVGAGAHMTCNEAVQDGDPKAMKEISSNSFDPRSP